MLRDAVLDAIAVLFPVQCAGCGVDDRALCAGCRAAMVPQLARQLLPDGTRVISAVRYEGVARRAILAFKESGRSDVATPLARALAPAVVAAVSGGVELVGVPGSAGGFRRRGYDPVHVLLCRARLPPPARVVRSLRDHPPQKTLDHDARLLNLAGTMAAVAPLTGRRFVVVDDVVTTGATIVETARAIRVAGGEVVAAATLAFTPRFFPLSQPLPT